MAYRVPNMLDHLVYGVPDLADSVRSLGDALGVQPTPGGSHPGRGTANALMDLGGGAYLEIIGPDPDQPEPDQARPFGIDELEGPRLVTWCIHPASFDAQVRQVIESGYDPGELIPLSRELPDGTLLEWRLATHSRNLAAAEDGLVPFLIDWGESPHPSATAARGVRLVHLGGRHPAPASIKPRLRAVGADLDLTEGSPLGLYATLETPRGEVDLR